MNSCWIFIDYMCLPQYKRTEEQQQHFSRAMKAMHVLYAHAAIHEVVRLENIKPLVVSSTDQRFIEVYCEATGKVEPRPFTELLLNSIPYSQRGWCIAEVQWMTTKDNIADYAPMTPAMFQDRVKRGRDDPSDPGGLVLIFTHRNDAEAVMILQEKVFLQHVQERFRLRARWLPCEQVRVLATTLASLSKLRHLELWYPRRQGETHEEMVFNRQAIATDTACAELAAAIPKCKTLKLIRVDGVYLFMQVHLLAENLRSLVQLEHLELWYPKRETRLAPVYRQAKEEAIASLRAVLPELRSQCPYLTSVVVGGDWALEYHTLILFFLKEPL